ncbi:MAG TPA: hypothetical protein PLZ99_02820 [Parcubacteria group bacterium]|nr:hypothetical protein [Parcubacteria group bacterium]
MDNDEKFKEILKVLGSKKNLRLKFKEDLDNLKKTQLELIVIAGATFSIFFALNKGPLSFHTKYGLVFLVISLLSGFISIIFDITNKFSNHFFDIIDIDTTINKNLNINDKKQLGIEEWGGPIIPDSFFKNINNLIVWNYIRKMLTEKIIFLFQLTIFIQFLAFLVAIVFMLLGLLKT